MPEDADAGICLVHAITAPPHAAFLASREEFMRKLLMTSLMLGAVAVGGGDARAQQPAPAPVPDAMPFDIAYGPSITIERAVQAVAATVAEATKAPRNWKLA